MGTEIHKLESENLIRSFLYILQVLEVKNTKKWEWVMQNFFEEYSMDIFSSYFHLLKIV